MCVRDSTSSSLIFSFSKSNYIKNINNPLLYIDASIFPSLYIAFSFFNVSQTQKLVFSEVNTSFFLVSSFGVTLGFLPPQGYINTYNFCGTRGFIFSFKCVIQLEFVVKSVDVLGCGVSRPDTVSEPPELAPSQRCLPVAGCHGGTGHWRPLGRWVLSPSGILVVPPPWLPTPHPDWFEPVATGMGGVENGCR